jgi:hypothetical protein
VAATSPRYEAGVNLLQFTLMLKDLSRQERYRKSLPLRLNPTLHTVDGGWRYMKEGGSRWLLLPHQRLLSAVLQYFEDGRRHAIVPLLEALESASLADKVLREAFERVVHSLIDEDVLRVDLCLPMRAASVFEALDDVVAHLLEPEQSRWSNAIRRIKLLCAQLSEDFEPCEPARVESLQRAIEEEVEGLWQAAQLQGKCPEPVIRLDMQLPLRITWSVETFEAAQRAAQTLLAFHAADGGAELFRRQTIFGMTHSMNENSEVHLLAFLADRWVAPSNTDRSAEQSYGCAENSGVTRELLFSRTPANSSEALAAAEQCMAWECLFEDVHGQHVYRLPAKDPQVSSLPGPWGALLLRFDGQNTVWIGPGRPEPSLFIARFTSLLEKTGKSGESFVKELRDHMKVAAINGIDLAEVVG